MEHATLGSVEPALAAVGAVLALCAAAAVGAVLWARRRWRRLRSELGSRAQALLLVAGRAGWRWVLTRPAPDRRWVATTARRRQLLRAVADAERAVAVADAAGAPIGDLRSLTRRLRSSADSLDASMSIDRRHAPGPQEPAGWSEQVDELLQAAAHIRTAAVRALSATTDHHRTGLAADAERELVAVSAGVGRSYEVARRFRPGPGPSGC